MDNTNCTVQEYQKYLKTKDQKHKNTKKKQKNSTIICQKSHVLWTIFYGIIKYELTRVFAHKC